MASLPLPASVSDGEWQAFIGTNKVSLVLVDAQNQVVAKLSTPMQQRGTLKQMVAVLGTMAENINEWKHLADQIHKQLGIDVRLDTIEEQEETQ
jgi:hypothetical protein